MPNTPLASALGKELHPPISSMIEMHGGQVKIEKRPADMDNDLSVGLDSGRVIY